MMIVGAVMHIANGIIIEIHLYDIATTRMIYVVSTYIMDGHA